MMKILALDTCFDACSVAVQRRDGEVVAERVLMRRGHAEALLPMIERTMQAAGLSFSELDRIAVTHGPGTFTGTRVGMAAALGIAVAQNIPVVTYSSLLCVARAGLERLAANRSSFGAIVVVHDAKRDTVCVEIVDMSGHEIAPPALMSISDACVLLGAPPPIVANHHTPAQVVAASSPFAPYFGIGSGIPLLADAQDAWPAALVIDWPSNTTSAGGDDPHAVEVPDARHLLQDAAWREPASPPRPLYLRPPDATPSSVPPLPRLPPQSFGMSDG